MALLQTGKTVNFQRYSLGMNLGKRSFHAKRKRNDEKSYDRSHYPLIKRLRGWIREGARRREKREAKLVIKETNHNGRCLKD